DQPLAVLMLIIRTGGTPTERQIPMAPKPTFPRNRQFRPLRHPERYRFRALDDFGDEVLDDWMVAYPAADLTWSDQALQDFFFERFLGTLAPFFRASDRPIAIACFLLFTF